MNFTLHPHSWGILAEYIILIRYILSGYYPLKHRVKFSSGEIDLIFKKGNKIVFVEVKARQGEYYEDNIVSKVQRKRLKKSAEYFLSKTNQDFDETRFDLAVVSSFFRSKIYKNFIFDM